MGKSSSLYSTRRIDLSDWVIHFVHDRKPEDTPSCFCRDFYLDDFNPMPDYFDENGIPITILDEEIEKDYSIEDDAPAFCVLKKILHDGYIKSGWSFRNFRPTIYGPYSAVCFTEMPLYALIEYARFRGGYSGYVGRYGIAFKKAELYKAGARPVIYGLSTHHIEADEDDPFFEKGSAPRLLSTTQTDIGPREQYRYVFTDLTNRKDWTHEREWRWPLITNKYEVPGLPFLMSEDYAGLFSQLIIIINTDDEKESISRYLKNMYDSVTNNFGISYNLNSLKNINILSIESLSKINGDLSTVKLEDIPFSEMSQMIDIKVKKETLEFVKQIWTEANQIAFDASTKFKQEINGKDMFSCGFSHVCTYDITEITQAFLDLKIAQTYSDECYILYGLNNCISQSLDIREVGAKAAAEYLTKKLGQNFYIHSRLD